MFEATESQSQTIWRHQVGDMLVATRTLKRAPDFEGGPSATVFTEGVSYSVLQVLPLVPAVVVIDDEQEQNKILPNFLSSNFKVKGSIK